VAKRKRSEKGPKPRPAILKPLGQQLSQLRHERDLTQEQLAERSGLSYKYIGQVELGHMEPGADSLVRFAHGLDVSMGDIFGKILPKNVPPRLSPTDTEGLSSTLLALRTTIERIIASQPPPAPKRARRRRQK